MMPTPPLGITQEAYESLGLKGRAHLWRKRYNLPEFARISDFALNWAPWDESPKLPYEKSALDDIRDTVACYSAFG